MSDRESLDMVAFHTLSYHTWISFGHNIPGISFLETDSSTDEQKHQEGADVSVHWGGKIYFG